MTLSYLAITSPDGEYILSPDDFDPRETSYTFELTEGVRYRIMAIPKDTNVELNISLDTNTADDEIVKDGDYVYLIPGEDADNVVDITLINDDGTNDPPSLTYEISFTS